ncbi:hypothetical protein C2W62_25190 [Candidatus Entotheonella serta]|nr:hypothetical protein C2W62_25190 [Candidatus Entotheonella serta]
MTLGDQARRAVFWNTGFTLFRDVLQFGLMLILVRLVALEAYGQFGLVTSIIGFLQVFSFEPFVTYTLQVRQPEQVRYQEHFTAGAFFQIGLFVCTHLSAYVLGYIESYATVAPVLHVMSVAWLLDWPSTLRIKMLERDLDWHRLRLLHALGLCSATVLSLGLAWAGAGLYALCLPGLLKRVVFLIDLFVCYGWRPTWTWHAKHYAPAWRFGLSRMASTLLVSGRKLLESSCYVHLAGFTGFAIFGRATGLTHLVCGKFALLIMQALYPVLTKIDPTSDTYRQKSGVAMRNVACVVLPLRGVCTLLASPTVRLLYGDRWLEAIPLIPWAMATGVIGALTHTAYVLSLAAHHKQRCLRADAGVLLGTGLALGGLLPHSAQAYLLGLCTIQVYTLFYLWSSLYTAWLHASTDLVKMLAKPTVATLCAWLICETVRFSLDASLDDLPAAGGYTVGFLISYIGVMRIGFTEQFDEFISYLPSR